MGKKEDAKLLGVKMAAGDEELRQAFRLLARQYHPDLVGDEFHDSFVRIREAYERLRDKHWDRLVPDDVPVEPVPAPRRRATSRRGADFIDLFDGFMQGLDGRAGPRKVLDVIEAEVPLDYLIFGAALSIYVPIETACTACRGRGMVLEAWGGVDFCRHCGGSGVREKSVKVPFNIPAGLRSGTQLRIPLDEAGLPSYDLVVEVTLSGGL